MNNYYDDHSGNDEAMPAEPVVPDPASTDPTGGSLYNDPTQPVEPVYPAYDETDRVVTPESENVDSQKEETPLDKVKKFFSGESSS